MKTSRWQLIRAYTQAKWRQRLGCSREWQDQQVARHLRRVLGASKWYRDKYSGLQISDWREWPTIDKIEMITHFDELNTVGISKSDALDLARRAEESRDFSPQIGNITVGLSSGTSGNTGIFLANAEERAAWAGNLLAKVLPLSLLHRQKIALFLRANSSLYESTKSKTIQFRYFDLLDSMEDHVQRWNDYKPDIVVAPPSMLRLLAERLEGGTLEHVPVKIISAAEKLETLDERIIQKAFGQTVHQLYQCTEGFLATTCQHGTLHINEDIVVVQRDYLDQNSGRFAPIITDFRRISQPIIRYRLDDILIEKKEPCPCGSPWLSLEQIEGRCDDLCFLRSANASENHVAVFPDFLRRAVITADPTIEDYALRQIDEETFAIALIGGEGAKTEERVCEKIQGRARSLAALPPHIQFEEMPIQKADIKKRRIRRECPLPDHLK